METVYYNGVIVTMEHDKKNIQAVLTENGRIKKTGSLEEISAVATESCCRKNLQGHTLMPGFIDSHSHFISYADSLLQADLSGAESIGEITERISAFIAENDILPGEWVRGKRYDHNFLQGRRHPILAELNAMSPDNPLVIQHQSGHVGLLNTYALNQLGITEETTQMYPGMIGWGEGGATGYLEETAFVEAIKNIPMPSEEKFFKAIKKAQDVYLSHGITTMQEGMVVQLCCLFCDML